MVKVNVKNQADSAILQCTKATGELFTIEIDTNTYDVIKKPEYPDIDASAVYSRAYRILRSGKRLPDHFVAEWG